MVEHSPYAPVLELVDWQVSEACVRKDVGVQVSPGAPKIKQWGFKYSHPDQFIVISGNLIVI